MEREPRLRLAARAAADPRRSSLDQPAAASRSIPVHRATRELRLRKRIDALLHQRHVKELRILHLEDRLRLHELPFESRVDVLEQRLKHANRRITDLSERLREARRVE